MRKFFVIVLLVITLLSLLVLPAVAFEADNGGVITADQVIDDDLFIEAQKVVVDGAIHGDLFVNGADVIINGPVNGNLLIFGAVAVVNGPVSGSIVFAGQSLELNGNVKGSVYAGGASVVLNPTAKLERNLYYGGYSFQSMPGSSVAIDLSLGCSQSILQGEVGRNVFAGVSAIEIDGSVGGNVDVTVDPPQQESFVFDFGDGRLPAALPSGIRVSKNAVVGGTLTYVSAIEQANTISLPSNQVAYHTLEVKQKLTPAEAFRKRSLSAVGEFVTLLILGGLALWLLPKPLQKSTLAVQRPLPALGWGVVIFLLFGPVALLLAGAIAICGVLLGVVTLGSLAWLVYVGGYLALALAALIFLVLAFYGSRLVVAGAVGSWLLQRFWPSYRGGAFWPLLIGLVIYLPLSVLPLPGEILIALLVSLIGLGAMWVAYRQRRQPPALPIALTPAASDELGEAVQ